jgi:hypothetical protein
MGILSNSQTVGVNVGFRSPKAKNSNEKGDVAQSIKGKMALRMR